jgi:hypothetical protein
MESISKKGPFRRESVDANKKKDRKCMQFITATEEIFSVQSFLPSLPSSPPYSADSDPSSENNGTKRPFNVLIEG